LEKYALNKIIFIPSGTSYFKTEVTDKWIRYQMVVLATNPYPYFEVTDIETKRNGNSYACNTIKAFKKEFPNDNFYWIMGSDTFLQLPTWKNHTFLLKQINFIVYMRPGSIIEVTKKYATKYQKQYHIQINIMDDIPYFISSSEIRAHIYDDNFLSSYLPISIETFIKENNLY
jgi:nicotinate-nucleotide adenylyltransferase